MFLTANTTAMSIEHPGIESQIPEEKQLDDSDTVENDAAEIQEKETSLILGDIKELSLVEQSMEALTRSGMSSSASGLETRRQETLDGILDWIKRNGRENLPEDVDVPLGDEATGRNIPLIELDEESIKEAQKEQRLEIVEKWKQGAVTSFTNSLKKSWRSRNALNLSVALKAVEVNVPASIDRHAKDYLDGKKDMLPGAVSIEWKHRSIIEQIMGKPNQITELKINFGSEAETLADEKTLIEQKSEDTQNSEKPDDSPNGSNNDEHSTGEKSAADSNMEQPKNEMAAGQPTT